MNITPTLRPLELSKLLDHPELRLFDCRFSLADTNLGWAQFLKSHLPKAQYIHLDDDLSSETRAGAGRHPLPSIEQARQMFESKGVSDNSIVVAYDANFSAFSSRLWWLARYAGLNNVRVLNGGLQAWAECEFSMSSENIKFDRGMIRNTASTMRVTSLTDVEKVADGRSNSILIDARDSIRYSGQKEPLDKKAGHVPHAVNLPFTNNMDDEGRFLATDLLKDRFCKISNKTGTGENIIHMCGSGVTACHNILAMEIAGITGSSLYPGSWSGWIDDEKHTIATV